MKIINCINMFLFGFCIVLLTSCADYDSDITSVQVAQDFRVALNVDDIDTMKELIGLPLIVIEQEWESAQDGIGFVLAKRKLVEINNKSELKSFLASFSPRVRIEGELAILIPQTEYTNFNTEFGESEEKWNGLDTYLFKRGEGDVEHIMLLGINPKGQKIKIIYLN